MGKEESHRRRRRSRRSSLIPEWRNFPNSSSCFVFSYYLLGQLSLHQVSWSNLETVQSKTRTSLSDTILQGRTTAECETRFEPSDASVSSMGTTTSFLSGHRILLLVPHQEVAPVTLRRPRSHKAGSALGTATLPIQHNSQAGLRSNNADPGGREEQQHI